MITTQLVALDIIRGAGGNPIPPPTPDTHDGAGWVHDDYHHKHKRNLDRFDRKGIRDELDAILGLAKEELSDEAIAPIETALHQEISRQTLAPALLAADLQRITGIADITQSLYDRVNAFALELYAEQDDEEALIALMQI